MVNKNNKDRNKPENFTEFSETNNNIEKIMRE